jgi:hypothetical protein
MEHNETLREGYPVQKVWGSSPYGCALITNDLCELRLDALRLGLPLACHFFGERHRNLASLAP